MKKFRLCWGKIEEFEIIKETNKQVFYTEYGRENRESIISGSISWHDTKQESIDYFIAKKNKEIELLQGQITYIQKEKKRFLDKYS